MQIAKLVNQIDECVSARIGEMMPNLWQSRIQLILATLAIPAILLSGCSSGTTFGKPPLTDEDIISMASDSGVFHDPTLSSTWLEVSPCELVSATVDDISDVSPDGTERRALVTAVLANESIEATQSYNCTYALSDKNWMLVDSWLADEIVVPTVGVDSDKVLSQVQSLIQQADDGEHEYADGKSCRLDDIYSEGAEYAVSRNDTDASGGDVTVSMSASTGFVSYVGKLTVEFVWDEEVNGWAVDDCSVDEDAYRPRLDEMVGTWNGELISTENVEHSNGECYGAKGSPMQLVVNTADSQTGTITADLTFLAHCHYREDNPIQSSEGDKTITLEDILIPVPYSTGSSVTAYRKEPPQSGFEFTKYEITFVYDSDGTIQASIRFQWGENDDGASAWWTDTYLDNYRLSKQGD